MRYSELCGKQVINITDGTMIGHIADMSFDSCSYEVKAFYITPCQSFLKKLLPWLFPLEQIEISIREIENIKGDVILVHVSI